MLLHYAMFVGPFIPALGESPRIAEVHFLWVQLVAHSFTESKDLEMHQVYVYSIVLAYIFHCLQLTFQINLPFPRRFYKILL